MTESSLFDLWHQCHRSVCSLVFLKDGRRIGSGSGFRVGDNLVTNSHVLQGVSLSTAVKITFVDADGNTPVAAKELTAKVFQELLISGEPPESWDFSILKIDGLGFDEIPSLALATEPDIRISKKIVLLGYHFDQTNLAIHTGYISSRFTHPSGVKYLQLDASVNNSNSGGPLIDPLTGEVIGIITRKGTGLSKQFDDLMKSFDANVEALRRSKGMMRLSGLDPVAVLEAGQHQMKALSFEIERSANVGIGYAYEMEKILTSFQKLGLKT